MNSFLLHKDPRCRSITHAQPVFKITTDTTIVVAATKSAHETLTVSRRGVSANFAQERSGIERIEQLKELAGIDLAVAGAIERVEDTAVIITLSGRDREAPSRRDSCGRR